MSPPSPMYRKVPGGRRGLSWRGFGSLWLADDHLLEATSVIVVENYRRFFFQDIRALVLQRTNGRSTFGWIFGGLGGVLVLIAGGFWWSGVTNPTEDWHIAMYVFASLFLAPGLVFLVLCLINLLRGPRCRCHVLTGAGWKVLSAPTRVGPASRLQAQLAALIQAAQSPASRAEPPSS